MVMKPDGVIKTRGHKMFHRILMRVGVKDSAEQRDIRNHGECGLVHPFVVRERPHDAQPRLSRIAPGDMLSWTAMLVTVHPRVMTFHPLVIPSCGS